MIVEELECVYIRNILLLLVIMSWLLVGCCGIALINLSVGWDQTLTQVPRFYGLKTGQNVTIFCLISENQDLLHQVEWYKASQYNTVAEKLSPGDNNIFQKSHKTYAIIFFIKVKVEDSGVYYCKINDTQGQGTELQVVKPIDLKKAVYRNKVKDGLIIFQVILLAMCIAAPLLRNHTLLKKEESIYDEPEQDHIYEGLTIETCGGGLYEEISVCGQAGGAEAPWRQDN